MLSQSSQVTGPGRGVRSPLWLLMVPLATLIYSVGLEAFLGPSGVGFPDPGYHYLFDGLNLLEGYPIERHIEHPGTPVQVIGAVAIRSIYALTGSGGIVRDLVERPKIYISGFFVLLMVLYALALAALGYAAWRRTGGLGAAVAIQALPQMIGNFLWLRPVTAECLVATVVAFLLFLVLRPASDAARPVWQASMYGAVVGFGMAVKLTFGPVALVPLLMLRTLKEMAWFAAAIIVSFVVSTLPIWPQYPRLVSWIVGIAMRDGQRRYGNGAAGLAPLSAWLANLGGLAVRDPVFAALLIAAAVILAGRLFSATGRGRPWTSTDRLLAGLTLCGVVQFLLTANQPESYYLFAARGTAGLLLWLVIERSPRVRRWTTEGRLLSVGVVLVAGMIVAGIIAFVVPPASLDADAAAIQDRLDAQYANTAKILYVGASSPAYALHQGNWNSGGHYAEALSKRYPGLHFYDGWEGGAGLCDWNGQPASLAEITERSRGAIFVGGHLVETGNGQLSLPWGETGLWSPPPARLHEVFRRGDEAIYEVADQ